MLELEERRNAIQASKLFAGLISYYAAFRTMLEVSIWLLIFLHLRQAIMADERIVPLTSEFIALLDDEKRYNRYATPTQEKGIATNVSMSMFIEGISSFSAQTMDYHLDMYMYQEWKDDRLRHNASGPLLIRDKQVFNKLWRPDIYFANAKMASFQEITEDNFLIWIYPNGRVWYDCRISLVAICMMDLWKYPLDSQMCELRILSYAYPETHLRLRWSTRIVPSIDRNMDIKMPDMNLVRIDTGECNGTYATGIWSCMTAVFYVERAMLHHVIQTYLPTALIVIISWFNFWLDIDSAPARVSLSITTLLTIATQANAVKLALPEVSYMKAIDAWMGMCMAFVFAVMVEYTIAHFAKNQEYLFQFSQNAQPPLMVDSETLNSLLNATASAPNPNDPEEAAAQEELEQFLTSEQLHRPWRKRVCGVLANGRMACDRGASFRHHRDPSTTLGNMRASLSARSFRAHSRVNNNNNHVVSSESSSKLDELDQHRQQQKNHVEKEPGSTASSSPLDEESSSKTSRNYLSADFYNMDEVRMKKLSSSSPEPFQYSTDQIMLPAAHTVQRKNSFRETTRVIRNRVNKRALLIKRTLNQLRGREMANKIDQKSRILFPLAFIIVNVCYWSYYMILN